MSGSLTPARRRRDESDEEEEEEEFEVSVDGESPPPSNRSKRARLDEDSEGEDEVEEQNAPLLPDSFRRSPKGKRRAMNGTTNGHGRSATPKTHQPGSIVRVTLTDFVTYTKAEFNPGPNLNMVIGPNGTGKSTLVCAICIGLGWATKHLGRAKDLGDFVKHGAKKARIDIELAADPERHDSNPVITTKIKKADTSNAEYLIDGKKENKKRVQELARSFSIQVDNLCQFLPQDRVVEFAGLSPVDLLTHTQRAAAPEHMSEWHEQLKAWRKAQKSQQADQQELAETIKKQEKRQEGQQADVDRLTARVDLQKRITGLEKMRVLPQYNDVKLHWERAKADKTQARHDLDQLELHAQPNLEDVTQKQQYLEIVKKALSARKKLLDRTEGSANEAKKKIDHDDEKIRQCKDKFEAEKNSTKAVRQSIPQLQRNVSVIQKAMETPPAAFDPAEMNDQVRQKSRRVRDLKDESTNVQNEVGSLDEQVRQREHVVDAAEKERENMRSQAGKQMSRVHRASADTATAWDWIQKNRHRFEGEVYGPPIVECRVKDQRHAPAVESMIQRGDALAFTVTTKTDFDMLTDQLYTQLRLREIGVRASLNGLGTFRTPTSTESLRQYGLEGWLLDLLEGPEAVLAMLCDNRNIHQTAYTLGDITQEQFNALQQSQISSWVTSKQSYLISRRREYGDKATSTRVQELRPAQFFTEMSVDHQQESGIERRIAHAQSEIEELNESKRNKMQEGGALKKQISRLEEERKAIDDEKRDKQIAKTQFDALPTKLEHAKGKLNEAKEKLTGSAERLRAIKQDEHNICLEKGQHAIDYASKVDVLRGLHVQLFEAEIHKIEAESDLEQLEAQHEEETRLLDEKRLTVETLTTRVKELLTQGRRLMDECNRISGDFTEGEQEIWEEMTQWSLEQWETEVVSVKARLDSLVGGGNENTLREFEARKKDIETKRRKFNELAASLDELEVQIADVRERWEPELDALVGEISEAFAENFAQIQCAGEVGVHKDEDFEHWAIQIKVKFRENEPLSLLDSHRQSGGERAVSTIFYLMALQSLARAPFRVVDEINQGMDPRNERLVHSRMVDIACAEVSEGRKGSQYFLITPKLLQGLKYHPDMKVHCIASGEHMPDDFREIDFKAAATRALELRARREGVAAG